VCGFENGGGGEEDDDDDGQGTSFAGPSMRRVTGVCAEGERYVTFGFLRMEDMGTSDCEDLGTDPGTTSVVELMLHHYNDSQRERENNINQRVPTLYAKR
jgi:hypothetical protein